MVDSALRRAIHMQQEQFPLSAGLLASARAKHRLDSKQYHLGMLAKERAAQEQRAARANIAPSNAVHANIALSSQANIPNASATSNASVA